MKLYSDKVYINEQFVSATIEFDNGKIINIIEGKDESSDLLYTGNKVFPGFVDIHTHGNHGVEANRLTEEGLKEWQEVLIDEGVTSFLVSTSTADEQDLLNSFKIASESMKSESSGAQVLGIHVEGPLISFVKRGAHNPYLLRKPNIEEFKKWQSIAQNQIKLVCIAPEMDDNNDLIKYCVSQGIKVALGHTNASYEQTVLAVENGANDFTHTFNAMPTLHHRTPGAVAVALTLDNTYAELIADGIHVHPAMCKILTRSKGKDKVIFVSDSSALKGLPAGKYAQGHRANNACYIREDGRIELEDHTLAGGSCKINQMLYRAIELMGIDEITAYNAVTKNPVTMLGIDSKGVIEVGKDADFTILNDDYSVKAVYCLGNQKK
ncbi:MAG: N-acetylglucosamine-6-phosphate deacetylase [Erysipelotrichaceae bacterium]